MSQVECKDCKHSFRTVGSFLAHGSGKYAWKCKKSFTPTTVVYDPVIGKETVKGGYENCSISRIGTGEINPLADNRCGEKGRFWQPKDKKNLFKYIKHVSAQ